MLDMLNGGAIVHGGCSAFLIDVYANLLIILVRCFDIRLYSRCSSMSLVALKMTTTGNNTPGVSTNMNILFHSPAAL